MLIYVYDWIKNLTSLVNNTNYTYIDDEDITYIVPPKNGNIILFADQPFEYITNDTNIDIKVEERLPEFLIFSGVIGVLFCLCGVLMYKASQPIKYEKINLDNYQESEFHLTNTGSERISDVPTNYSVDDV